jgi:hypothetical protein
MACLRLFTFLPLLPLLRVPRLRLRMARSTSFEALREYRRAIVQLRTQFGSRPLSGHSEPGKQQLKAVICSHNARPGTVHVASSLLR